MNFWDTICIVRMAVLNYFGFSVGHFSRCSDWSMVMECPKCDFSAESDDELELARSCAYHTATAHPEDESFTRMGKSLLTAIVEIQRAEAEIDNQT